MKEKRSTPPLLVHILFLVSSLTITACNQPALTQSTPSPYTRIEPISANIIQTQKQAVHLSLLLSTPLPDSAKLEKSPLLIEEMEEWARVSASLPSITQDTGKLILYSGYTILAIKIENAKESDSRLIASPKAIVEDDILTLTIAIAETPAQTTSGANITETRTQASFGDMLLLFALSLPEHHKIRHYKAHVLRLE